MSKGMGVVKLNKSNFHTRALRLSLGGGEGDEPMLLCMRKLCSSQEQLDLKAIIRVAYTTTTSRFQPMAFNNLRISQTLFRTQVQRGELPNPDDQLLGTATLRAHAEASTRARVMRDGGLCFSLVFPDRTLDLAAASREQRDFLATGFECLVTTRPHTHANEHAQRATVRG